nr:polysaccharide deacetylase family protein [Planococcus salinus]
MVIHMKWIILGTSLALLTACGNDNSQAAEEPEAAPETQQLEESTASNSEEVTEESVEKPEETEEIDTVEEIEQKEPQYRVNPATWGVEPIADAPAEAVLITIDDAPDKHAVKMAETLQQLDIPAIFFVNGHFLDTDEEKEQLRKIHDMGFAIGNHTNSHPNLKNLTEEQQREEIITLSETVESIIGEKPAFFRAPHGSNTDFSKALVEQEGMVLMNWSYGYDWEQQYMDAGALADIMVHTEFLRNGANLLMHDREWTAEALPAIAEGLKQKGYTFVDPDEIEGVNP